jgi:hypothetical protein
MRAWVGLVAGVFVLAGCGGSGSNSASGTTTASTVPPAARPASGAPPWVLPRDPLKLVRRAGLRPGKHEFLLVHRHAHLDVVVNGQRVEVPGGIGIQIHDPGVKSDKSPDGTPVYGGIKECRRPCISPLHTHSDDGVLHTESSESRPNRLGQLFVEWNVRLTPSCVGGFCKPAARIRVYVDGAAYAGDPRQIALTDGKEIAIVIGTPPATIPSKFPRG